MDLISIISFGLRAAGVDPHMIQQTIVIVAGTFGAVFLMIALLVRGVRVSPSVRAREEEQERNLEAELRRELEEVREN